MIIFTSVYYQLPNMAYTVKLFQFTKIYVKRLGIYPTEPNQNFGFTTTSVFILLAMFVTYMSTVAFFLLEAGTIDEYIKTFYASSSIFGFMICFVILTWKMALMLELIENYEGFIRKSESNLIANECSQVYETKST